ncbi:MAG: hypothetical protein U0L09_08710, partial [Christensenellales bacterium]|nr:hypothetical protein [Christensenellales bacterium]
MKKRIIFALIVGILMMLTIGAHADQATGQGQLVVHEEGMSAYVDGSGNLYISGDPAPLNTLPATSVVSIDPYRIVFISTTRSENAPEKSALVCLDLSGKTETTLYEDIYSACLDTSGRLYFVPRDNRTEIRLVDFDKNVTTIAHR